jgi:hypothetical protein
MRFVGGFGSTVLYHLLHAIPACHPFIVEPFCYSAPDQKRERLPHDGLRDTKAILARLKMIESLHCESQKCKVYQL